jgi:hypothetical protein
MRFGSFMLGTWLQQPPATQNRLDGVRHLLIYRLYHFFWRSTMCLREGVIHRPSTARLGFLRRELQLAV